MAAHNAMPVEEYDYDGLGEESTLVANLASGAFAGIMEHTVMYPIDAIKTRMQLIGPSSTVPYTGIANAISQISSQEGARRLWRGITSVALGAGPAHAVYFATYEVIKHRLGGNEGLGHHPFATAGAGACATIASDALMNPFDVLKQRMQLRGNAYNSLAHCARTVYGTEGLAAFYVSYPTTLSMTIPFQAIQFSTYESMLKYLNPSRDYSPAMHCAAGAIAGALAASLTTPLDVIKTLLQTRGSSADPEIRNCRGLWHGAQLIYGRNGATGFFRGLQPRVITAMPSTAICWTSYEMAKFWFLGDPKTR